MMQIFKNIFKRKSPVDAWAFMRVKDEMRTLPACLKSILPVINKGVIAYNPSSDTTEEEFILDFCSRHSGFIPLRYDHPIIPAGSKEYLNNKERERHLDTYYNTALNIIPDNEWLIKIDADQIYDTNKLAKLLCVPKNDWDVVFVHRLNLHIYQNKLQLIHYPLPSISNHNDHWLIKKRPDMCFRMHIKQDKASLAAYELLNLDELVEKYNLKCKDAPLTTWHFPYLKSYRQRSDLQYVPLSEYARFLDLKKLSISPEMVDEEYVTNFLNSVGFVV